eukprot:m.353832 g.353832  ORF g.353832 m.353832 type:complete len:358 (-) comp16840_c0_seq1:99-1172(-)
MADTKLPAAALFLACVKELWGTKNGNVLALVHKCDISLSRHSVLLLCCCWAHNGHRLVGHGITYLQCTKVQALKKLLFTHEAGEWAGPALSKDLKPLHGKLVDVKLWKGGSLGGDGLKLVLIDKELLHVAVRAWEHLLLLKKLDQLLDVLSYGLARSTHNNVWVLWRLIHTVNTGEALDLTSTCTLVQTLWITGLANFQRRCNVHLQEFETGLLMNGTHKLAVSTEWADEGCKGNNATICKEVGNLTHTADVLRTVLGAKSKVLVQTSAHVVAIKTVAWDTTTAQLCLQGKAEGGLTSTRQTCEPEGAATELDVNTKGLSTLGAGHVVLDRRDVCCLLLCHRGGWKLESVLLLTNSL